MRYYFITTRMATIKKADINTGKHVESVEPSYTADRKVNYTAFSQ